MRQRFTSRAARSAAKCCRDGSEIFRAIPYAAPPVGELRWKPPAPVISWTGVRDAVNAPHPCMQLDEGWNAAAASFGSEDCLYLSLHTPRHKAGAKLPVFLWIHGGANRAGSGYGFADSLIYKHGIVMVGIEYRLGVFGFLASPELSAESPHKSSGNYALMDQIAALHWVHDNIAAFGGDPNNVTIGGQSSGAVDVGQLLRSPLARGLFAKAIEESGAPGLPRKMTQNEKIGSDFLAHLGLSPGPKALTEMRTLPADKLLTAGTKLLGPDGNFESLWIATSADTWVLPGSANDIYNDGNQAQVPLLIGNTTQEFLLPASVGRGIIMAVFRDNAERALALYGFQGDTQPPDDPVLGTVGTQVITDLAFRCSANQMARWEDANRVWRYQFGIPQAGMDHVEHTAELDYVFGQKPANATFATWPPVQDYWANFIIKGNPNGSGLAQWPALGKDKTYLAFMPSGPELGHDLRGPICRLMVDSTARAERAGIWP